MKALLIAALSAVVMLAGCASSTTFQLKQKRAADNSREKREYIKNRKAAEIAKEVLACIHRDVEHGIYKIQLVACSKFT